MAKSFDAALKQLIDQFAEDWSIFLCRLLGFPADAQAKPIDADLSTVTSVQSDKLFEVSAPVGGLIHLEVESSWSADLGNRVLLYNTLSEHRYGGPVRSVVILLRREANSPLHEGNVIRRDEHGPYLQFRYQIIRLWGQQAEGLLGGPIGLAPLALLTDDAQTQIPSLIKQIETNLKAKKISAKLSNQIWTSCLILLGLRYNSEVIGPWFRGIRGMRESSTYQAILEEGRQEGRNLGKEEGSILEARKLLIEMGELRFGKAGKKIRTRLEGIQDLHTLESLLKSLLSEVESWDQLLSEQGLSDK